MCDYFKINSLPVIPEKLLNNPLLIFTHSNISTEGELLDRWQIANYNSLTFKIKGNNSKLVGSLHKYRQGGKNWKDFKLWDIQDSIKELSENFDFDPEKAFINFIEIGVNIAMDYSPNKIIDCLVIHGKEQFKELPIKRNTKGNGRILDKDQYAIKIYNKSLQYGLPDHLLRFEIKVKKMKFLERYGIKGLTLLDLTNPAIYPKFKTMLLDILTDVIIYNPDIDPDKITTLKDRDILKEGRYSQYWQRLERRRKSETLKRFKELAGTTVIIENLKNKVSEKWDLLYNTPDKLTTFSKEEIKQTTNANGQINPTIKGNIVHTCTVTGLTIYNQRIKAKYLSAKGVKWYFENDPETYKNKLEVLLTEKWITRNKEEPIEKYFNEIYHQIRNQALNPKNNTIRGYLKIENKGLKLFPTSELLPPDKRKHITFLFNLN